MKRDNSITTSPIRLIDSYFLRDRSDEYNSRIAFTHSWSSGDLYSFIHRDNEVSFHAKTVTKHLHDCSQEADIYRELTKLGCQFMPRVFAIRDRSIKMERYDGTLVDLVSSHDVNLYEVAHELMRLVHDCHRAGFTHRDLKPTNILYRWCDSRFELRLTDFEFASRRTIMSDICGTPRYMSPLVYTGSYSQEVDLYSLAITLEDVLSYASARILATTGQIALFTARMALFRRLVGEMKQIGANSTKNVLSYESNLIRVLARKTKQK